MNEKDNYALVPRPPSEIEKAKPGARRVLSGIVADTLTVAKSRIEFQKGTLLNSLDTEELCQRGRKYYDKGKYLDAAECFRVAAQRGHPDAQYMFGLLYHSGDGVVEDHCEAVKWYRKAAEQGDEIAQIVLGNCYENGEGVAKDIDEAKRWHQKAIDSYHEAAERGEDWAQFNLANYYQQGILGLTQNYVEAAKWYRKAAEQGNADAQSFLGDFYDEGQGVPKDPSEAMRWYLKAAGNGNVPTMLHISDRYRDGKGVEIDLIEAYKWLRLAVDQEDLFEFKLAPLRALLTEAQVAEAEARYRKFYATRHAES